MRRNPGSNAAVAAMHRRGYHKGDIRCSACMKWLNPNKPEEAQEIEVRPSGRRVHGKPYCDGIRHGGAMFTTTPRYAPARRKRMEEVFRY